MSEKNETNRFDVIIKILDVIQKATATGSNEQRTNHILEAYKKFYDEIVKGDKLLE